MGTENGDMGFRREYIHEDAVEVLGSARGHMGHVRIVCECGAGVIRHDAWCSQDQQNIIGYSSGPRKTGVERKLGL